MLTRNNIDIGRPDYYTRRNDQYSDSGMSDARLFVEAIPEPSAILLLVAGLAAYPFFRAASAPATSMHGAARTVAASKVAVVAYRRETYVPVGGEAGHLVLNHRSTAPRCLQADLGQPDDFVSMPDPILSCW